MIDGRIELDQDDKERIERLLNESSGDAPKEQTYPSMKEWLAAYQCVLLKDVRFALNELLSFKMAERY